MRKGIQIFYSHLNLDFKAFYFLALGIKPRALWVRGKCCTIELHTQSQLERITVLGNLLHNYHAFPGSYFFSHSKSSYKLHLV